MAGLGSDTSRLEMDFLASSLLSSTPSNTKDLTPVALSTSISQNKVEPDYAGNNDLIIILAEIFESIDGFVKRLNDEIKAKGILQTRDDIFLYLNSFPSSAWLANDKDYLDPRFLVYWRWLLKSYSSCDVQDEQFEKVLKRVNKVLAGKGGGGVIDSGHIIFGSDLLFKYGGHPLICQTLPQARAKGNLLSISGSLISHKKQDSIIVNLTELVESNDPTLYADTDFKRELLMALCTLHHQSTDEASSSSDGSGSSSMLNAVDIIEGLVAKMAKLRLNFEHSLKKATIDVEIRTVENDEEAYRLLKEVQEGAGFDTEGGKGQEVVRNLMTKVRCRNEERSGERQLE